MQRIHNYPSVQLSKEESSPLWTVLVVLTVFLLMFLPVDVVALFVSLYSGLTWLFFIVWTLFAIKLANIACLFILEFRGGALNKRVFLMAFTASGIVFLIAFIALIAEMMRVTKDIKAVFMSPFVLDMIPIIVVDVLAAVYANLSIKARRIYYQVLQVAPEQLQSYLY